MRELWAELLVSAVENAETEHVAFVHVLRNLNGDDARVLKAMIECGYARREDRVSRIVEHTKLEESVVNFSMANLQRLGFFSPYGTKLNGFAVSFMRACGIALESLPEYLDSQKEHKGRIFRE